MPNLIESFLEVFFDDVTITINPFGKSDNRYYPLDSLTNPILNAKCFLRSFILKNKLVNRQLYKHKNSCKGIFENMFLVI